MMITETRRGETTAELVLGYVRKRPLLLLVVASLCVVSYVGIRFTVGEVHYKVRRANRNHTNPYGEAGEQRLPQAIVIGIRKAGTRAMLSFLGRHPDVRIARAECHFFAHTPNYIQGLEFYRKQMPYSKPNQITIEKTPNYFHRGDIAAERIHAMNNSIKLILVLREPVARAVSDYIQFYQNKGDTRLFGNMAYINGQVNKLYGPVQRSNYYKILQKYWLKYFNTDQIHIVDGDALGRENPGKEMKLVQQFLGIRQIIDENSFVFDKQKKFYCLKGKDGTAECLKESKGRPHPQQDEKIIQELKRYYEPYNQRLFAFIGRDFGWNS